MKPSASHWPQLRDRWLLLALATPLVVSPWGYDTAELPKLTFLRILALLLMVTGLFTLSRSAWASSKEAQISEIHPLRLPIMLFLIIMGVAALQSPDQWSSLGALVDAAMLAFYTFSFTGAARNPRFQRNALRMMVGVGGVCAAWALLQMVLRDPLNGAAVQRAGGQPTGPFAEPILLAAYLAAVFPAALWQVARESDRKRLIWNALCALLLFLALAVSPFRAPLIAASIASLLTLALLRNGSRSSGSRIWMSGMAALLLFIAALAGGKGPSAPAEYLAELRATSVRVAQARPTLGWGPGAFGLVAPAFTRAEPVAHVEANRSPAPSPRNEALSLLVSGGLAAAAAFAWILIGAAMLLVKRLRSEKAGDAAQAAAWAGFLASWAFISLHVPQSIALQAPFWCALGLASSPSREEDAVPLAASWPVPLRWAGALAALLLIVPLPRPELIQLMRTEIDPAMRAAQPSLLLEAGLVQGPGAATRWLIGDVHYARAVRARQAEDWDAALVAHMNALLWAPSRMGNWIGYGQTAYDALRLAKKRPFDWVQYGQLGYVRAQKMQPDNGYLHYGEARLLTQAIRKGAAGHYADARKAYERAIALYPHLARFHTDFGVLHESVNETEPAMSRYREAAALGSPHGEAQWRLGRLLCRMGRREEGLRYLKQAAAVDPQTNPLREEIRRALEEAEIAVSAPHTQEQRPKEGDA